MALIARGSRCKLWRLRHFLVQICKYNFVLWEFDIIWIWHNWAGSCSFIHMLHYHLWSANTIQELLPDTVWSLGGRCSLFSVWLTPCLNIANIILWWNIFILTISLFYSLGFKDTSRILISNKLAVQLYCPGGLETFKLIL